MAHFGGARFSSGKEGEQEGGISDGGIDESSGDHRALVESRSSGGGGGADDAHDIFEQCGRWLLSIPTDEAKAMHHTREYRDFLRAVEGLQQAQRKVQMWNPKLGIVSRKARAAGKSCGVDNNYVAESDFDLKELESVESVFSFLQHMAADDIILRVFEFLDSQVLARAMMTCTRFRELAERSARQRTRRMSAERQLSNILQVLRAKEQVDGVATSLEDRHVRVPTLLLSRRVRVTNSGDPDYNGVYYCTGSNGNGFVFTKPRQPEQRVDRSHLRGGSLHTLPDEIFLDSSRLESEVAQPGHLLRCIIAKRFSNETLLWYCSKEVVATEATGDVRVGDVTQVFSFWAKLMVIGDASPDICRYPSQSSILIRHNEGWQTLSTTRTTHPPTVELLD